MNNMDTPGAAEQPPYGAIWEQFEAGEVIPFLGAGASLCGRPEDHDGCPVPWTGAEDPFLPNGRELGNWLADKCSFPDPAELSDLAKVASYYEIRMRRGRLVRRLRDVFCQDYTPGPIHQLLASSPRPLLIVTTNYDDLIEKAFAAIGRPYHLIAYPEREEYAGSVLWWRPDAKEPEAHTPTTLPLSLTDTSIIYKMHGTVSVRPAWNSFVITEEDYVRFLARMTDKRAIPARFMMQFMRSAFLFLGYGLADWNLRVMLENLKTAFRYEPKRDTAEKARDSDDPFGEFLGQYSPHESEFLAWAIQHRPSTLEKTLWTSRNVQIFDVNLDEFTERLRAACRSEEQKRALRSRAVQSPVLQQPQGGAP